MRIILASGSPRRAQVLKDAGIVFETVSACVDESRRKNEAPEEFVRRLAEAKARDVAGRLPGEAARAIVVGADTVVVVDGPAERLILGKPCSPENARDMLRRLSGRTHTVITGLAAIRLPDSAARVEHETTRVTFAALPEKEIEDYVTFGEPFDKAGAYAIQGRGGRFVTCVEGCYFNVVGLPLARLCRILREWGWA